MYQCGQEAGRHVPSVQKAKQQGYSNTNTRTFCLPQQFQLPDVFHQVAVSALAQGIPPPI